MLRTRLLTATAAVALFSAGAAFAQTAPTAPVGPATTPPVAAEEPTQEPAPAPAQAAAPTTPSTQAAATTPAVSNNVVDVLRANGQFTTLLSALDAAQLTETLRTQPAISIFAPTDAAFAALPEADRARLMDPANVNELRQVLLYHVVVADVNSSQIEGARGGVQTAATTEVQLDGTGDAIKVDNATVTTADIDAGNGAVFIIDRVLNPAESQVATGDAEEATTTAAPAADATETATPPAEDAADEATPPADDSATADAMDADSAADEAVAPPPTTTAVPAPPAAAPTAPMTSPTAVAPAATTTTAPRTTTTTTPAPAPTGVNAPNGQPAATTTTTASPPVANPTDGQVDDEDADDADDMNTPTPQA